MKLKTSRRTVWEHAEKKCVEITKSVEHNINHYVQVKLTEDGLAAWRGSVERLFRGENPQRIDERFDLVRQGKYIGDGWYEFQVHELLGLFGKLFHEGMAFSAKLPFETTVRYVDRSFDIINTTRV